MERIVLDILRLMERVVPPSLLAWLLWPIAAFWSAWELAYHQPTVKLFRRLPLVLRPAWRTFLRPVRVWRHRCRLNLTKLLNAWPNRLQEPRWKDRCRLIGFERFEKLWGAGHPVVLAGLHFGPVSVFYNCLRARGLPVAALVGRDLQWSLTYRRRLGQRVDRLRGLERIPRTFEVRQLYEAVEFLRSPGILLTLADGGQGRQLLIPGEGYGLLLSPGAFRLAALAGAVVLPALVYAEPGMRLTVQIGEPVPDDYIRDRRRHEAACAWLLRSFAPVLREHPEQCSAELLYRFRPQTTADAAPTFACATG
jgi:lauroyl/myristoyl acyltransferase